MMEQYTGVLAPMAIFGIHKVADNAQTAGSTEDTMKVQQDTPQLQTNPADDWTKAEYWTSHPEMAALAMGAVPILGGALSGDARGIGQGLGMAIPLAALTYFGMNALNKYKPTIDRYQTMVDENKARKDLWQTGRTDVPVSKEFRDKTMQAYRNAGFAQTAANNTAYGERNPEVSQSFLRRAWNSLPGSHEDKLNVVTIPARSIGAGVGWPIGLLTGLGPVGGVLAAYGGQQYAANRAKDALRYIGRKLS